MQNGMINHNATCTVSNKKGSWVTMGGAVTVKKSSDDLQVKCVDNETDQVALQTAPKKIQVGWAVANFFLWDLCTISCLIDFPSGSIYQYPSQVQVVLPPALPEKDYQAHRQKYFLPQAQAEGNLINKK